MKQQDVLYKDWFVVIIPLDLLLLWFKTAKW
jgi:hypothetical protein